jgi:hypothetical protein
MIKCFARYNFRLWNHQGYCNYIGDQLRSGSYGTFHLLVMAIPPPIMEFA